MIQDINISGTDYYISTDAVLYAYEGVAGALVIVADKTLMNHTAAIEMIPASPNYTVNGTTYAAFKAATSAGQYDDFTHATLTEVYVNCQHVKRIIEQGTDTLIYFNNTTSVTVSELVGAVKTKINAKVNVTGGGGGGGGLVVTTVEVNLGAISSRGSFDIADSACLTTSEVNVWQGYLPLTGKGTREDENEMDRLIIYAKPNVGRINVRWEVNPIFLAEKLAYNSHTRNLSSLPVSEVLSMISNKRRGLVKGNFKFKYTIQN
jgi:hypothetical protein